MEQNPEANELDLVQVIDDKDDFVQILGVTPDEDSGDIEVSSVEFDEGESFFIDVDDESFIDAEDGQEMMDIPEVVSSEDSFDSDDIADSADVI